MANQGQFGWRHPRSSNEGMASIGSMMHARSQTPTTANFQYAVASQDGGMSFRPYDQEFVQHGQMQSFGFPAGMHQNASPHLDSSFITGAYGTGPYQGLSPHHDAGMAVQYNGFGNHHGFYMPAQIEYDEAYLSSMQHEEHPPKARSASVQSEERSPRNARSTSRSTPGRTLRSNRVTKSPKVRKSKSAKANAKVPKLDAPLSVLTKHLVDIPIRDMEAYVNRSAEDRLRETEKRKGYVTRPMNSFMMYRSAYAERTKAWCTQNNHQVVSTITGVSWPLESEEIHKQYSEYAKLERENHAKAHPNYKFSPSKGGPNARKRKDIASTDDDEDGSSDADDFEWHPSGERRSGKSRRTPSDDFVYRPQYSPMFGENGQFDQSNALHQSTWDMGLDGKSMLSGMGSPPLFDSQFYPSMEYPVMGGMQMDDSGVHVVDNSGGQFAAIPSGVPGGYGPEVFENANGGLGFGHYEEQVDPSLLQQFHRQRDDEQSGQMLPDTPSIHRGIGQLWRYAKPEKS